MWLCYNKVGKMHAPMTPVPSLMPTTYAGCDAGPQGRRQQALTIGEPQQLEAEGVARDAAGQGLARVHAAAVGEDRAVHVGAECKVPDLSGAQAGGGVPACTHMGFSLRLRLQQTRRAALAVACVHILLILLTRHATLRRCLAP